MHDEIAWHPKRVFFSSFRPYESRFSKSKTGKKRQAHATTVTIQTVTAAWKKGVTFQP
jgi:hypothetical protein